MKIGLENKIIAGALIWIGLASGGLIVLRDTSAKAPGGVEKLTQFFANQRFTTEIEFPEPRPVALGDLVFHKDSDTFAPVGHVSRVGGNDPTTKDIVLTDRATITFYGNAPTFSEKDFLTHHVPNDDMAWVVQTMLPLEKRQEITKIILEAYSRDREQIVASMKPVVSKSISDASSIIREDVLAALAKREDRLTQIGKRYRYALVEQQLVPLIREEIWPIVREESEPLAAEIGQEIWREVSVFRFAWRYLYDQSVVPEDSLTRKELERFLEKKVAPIIQKHLKDLMAVQNSIVIRVSQNERVQETFVSAIKTITSDPEIQEVFSEILQEALLNNDRLRESFRENWNSPEAVEAIRIVNERLEPTITEIGTSLFGSTKTEITPEFAQVLRHRILKKDSRWLTLHVSQPDTELSSNSSRGSRPQKLTVQIAQPAGLAPYAPGRKR